MAIKNVPMTLSIFDDHFPRFAVLPGVLLLQGLTELATLVAGGKAWRLRCAHTVRFRHFVRPGDQVVITAQVTKAGNDVIELTATAQAGENTVASARRLVLERT